MADQQLEIAPWGSFLKFRDPVLEEAYWAGHVENVLLPCDRAMNVLMILALMVVYSMIEHLEYVDGMLLALSVLIPAGHLVCTFASGGRYALWRPQLLVPEKISMLLITGFLNTRIGNLCGSAACVFITLLIHSNCSILIICTLGLQSKFRTHVMLQFVLVALSIQFSSSFCDSFCKNCQMSSLFGSMATKIDNMQRILMTFSWLLPEMEPLETGTACLFTSYFSQWAASLVAGLLLYSLESYSRVTYLLSHKRHHSRMHLVLWRAWRHAVLMCCWNCLVGLTIVLAVIKMSVRWICIQ